MLFVDFFDTAGTLIGVTNQAGLLTEDGKLPRGNRALVSDAIATMGGAPIVSAPIGLDDVSFHREILGESQAVELDGERVLSRQAEDLEGRGARALGGPARRVGG